MFVFSIAPEKGEGKGRERFTESGKTWRKAISGKNIPFDSREKQGKIREAKIRKDKKR